MLDGGVNLRDLETQMNWRLPRDGGVETLAGFLLARLGKIPTGGETVDYMGRRFTVLEMSGHRISKVRVEPENSPVQQTARVPAGTLKPGSVEPLGLPGALPAPGRRRENQTP